MAPERLSSVGARNAQAGASRGANTPGMGTPAETILGGQEHDEAADIAEPVRSSLEPIPEAGSEIELDQLTFILRSAIFERDQDEARLTVLRDDALPRARAQVAAEQAALAEAEVQLREVKLHSKGALIEAFVSGQPTDTLMSEAAAKAELDRCRDLLATVSKSKKPCVPRSPASRPALQTTATSSPAPPGHWSRARRSS